MSTARQVPAPPPAGRSGVRPYDQPLTGRRRRPSGEPAPLPRGSLESTGRGWLAVTLVGLVCWILVALVPPLATAVTVADLAVVDAVARLRVDWLTDVMLALHALGSTWLIRPLRWLTIAVLVAFRRWRALAVLLLTLWLFEAVLSMVAWGFQRPRPVGVEILGAWKGFAHPSLPVAGLTITLVAMLYTLVPRGRGRNLGKWLVAAVVGLLVAARLYLGVDHPTDALASFVAGVTYPLVAFRVFTPDDAFPVTYRRGRAAHLALDPRRLAAIRTALRDQLGLDLRDVRPFNLEESFGSTPLRLEVAGGAERLLFAKLYAASHMRADRWYKLGRTLRYGRLEDERPFNTVRRLVQYEDYMLRVMRDAGLPVAEPVGIVELTPEREYLIVTEFFDGARELGDPEVEIDVDVVDDALAVVRRMWDTGLAHRDIKPANVLLRADGRVALIDVFFGEVRPSPWRQAVDLAAMMLVLALKIDVEVVYQRALRLFTAEEIAEAFAATSAATRPSLRKLFTPQGRDLAAAFRALAPPHPRIAVQRWSARRVGLTIAVAVSAFLVVSLVIGNLTALGLR